MIQFMAYINFIQIYLYHEQNQMENRMKTIASASMKEKKNHNFHLNFQQKQQIHSKHCKRNSILPVNSDDWIDSQVLFVLSLNWWFSCFYFCIDIFAFLDKTIPNSIHRIDSLHIQRTEFYCLHKIWGEKKIKTTTAYHFWYNNKRALFYEQSKFWMVSIKIEK